MMRKRTFEDRFLDMVVYALLFLVVVISLYPVIYVFSNSISSPDSVLRKEVWLLPIGFSMSSYELAFEHKYIMPSYLNTVIYTVCGTLYSMVLTILGGYALSRKRLIGRDFFMLFIGFTMLFGGGLIPTYLLVKQLGMINTIWAMIIPCAISPFNLILIRTSMQQIPDSLEESARIDGANDWVILFRIVLPMSIPVLATITLFYAIGQWNGFLTALIYLNSKELYPLQLILRELLITMTDNTMNREMTIDKESLRQLTPMGFKSAIIMISMLPLLVVYPFIQRYFVKGVMIGAIKG